MGTILRENIDNIGRTLELAKVNQKKNFKTSDLGWVWAIVKPMFYICIFYTAITLGIRGTRNIEGLEYPYFVWFVSGMVPWFYIQGIIIGGANCFRRYAFLIKKFDYPLTTLPTVICLSNIGIHIIMLGVGLVICMIYGAYPSVYWLQLPFYMILMMMTAYVWSLGAGMLATLSGDVMDLLRAIQPAFFWLSGILFNSRGVDKLEIVFKLNPITFIVEGYRNCLCFHIWFWEDLRSLAGFLVIFTFLLVVALILNKRLRKRLPDYM